DDSDFNGKIDRLDLYASENLNDSGGGSYGDIAVNLGGGYTYSAINTGDSAGDALFRILLTENAGGCDKDDVSGCDTSATPSVTVTANTQLVDFNANPVPSAALVATIDTALPVVIARGTSDGNHNGEIDTIGFIISEDVNLDFDSLTATVAGYTTGSWGSFSN